jgi:hypothetical protein
MVSCSRFSREAEPEPCFFVEQRKVGLKCASAEEEGCVQPSTGLNDHRPTKRTGGPGRPAAQVHLPFDSDSTLQAPRGACP